MIDISTREPVDKQARVVTGKGVNYNPKLEQYAFISKTPIPTRRITKGMLLANGFKNLTGVTFDRLTVVGLSENQLKRWVCRCVCGNYTVRRSKSLLKKGTRKLCPECDNLQHIKWVYDNK